jgi:haloalkane dehalogenase
MDWLDAFISGLNLRDITLFCQDWGSLLGLRHAAEHSDRYARIMVSNGFLPTGELGANSAFRLWRGFARYSPVFPVGAIVNSGCVQKLSDAEIAAYDAPFPSQAYKAAARAFPLLVPTDTRNPASAANQAAWAALSRFEKPFLCVFGKNDPILGKADKPLIAAVPGARGQAHERTWGGHFIQEDRGAYLAGRMADFMMGVVSQQAAKETVR